MNGFDYSILSYFSQFAGRHPAIDQAITRLTDDGLLKGGIIVALLWWAWFKDPGTPANEEARERVVAAIFASGISIVLARLLTLTLPFRIRPLVNPSSGLHFPPAGLHDWENWSSFPSDNAILYFALTTSLFLIAGRFGWLALIDTVFLVCLPRVYLGIHYPTDILAGAVIGIAMGAAFSRQAFRQLVSKDALRWMNRHPSSFYASFFVLGYEIVTSFTDVRLYAKWLVGILVSFFTKG